MRQYISTRKEKINKDGKCSQMCVLPQEELHELEFYTWYLLVSLQAAGLL